MFGRLGMHKPPFITVGLELVPAKAGIRVDVVSDRLELLAELLPSGIHPGAHEE
jgi:hypothetical protein